MYLGDTPIATIKNGTAYYVYADQIDTPRVITDTNNLMVWRWDQADPFGVALPDENPTSLGAFKYNLRFPGQVYDAETGKHYNVNRDYGPASGRYIQSDPIGLNGGQWSTYSYVNGNPVNETDPTGKFGLVGGLVGAGFDIGMQMIIQGKSLKCVNISSVLTSAVVGAFTPGLLTVGGLAVGAEKTIATWGWLGARDAAVWQGVGSGAGVTLKAATKKQAMDYRQRLRV